MIIGLSLPEMEEKLNGVKDQTLTDPLTTIHDCFKGLNNFTGNIVLEHVTTRANIEHATHIN